MCIRTSLGLIPVSLFLVSGALAHPAEVAAQVGDGETPSPHETVESAPLSPEQLISYTSLVRDPSWAPDGDRILFSNGHEGGLWSISPSGGEPTKVTEGGGQARFSPDGEWIAYVSEKSGAPELYAWSSSTDREVRLTNLGARMGAYSWSPDSRTIAFSNVRYGSMDVWTVSVPDGQVRRLTGDTRYEVYPSWTPDGTTIVFQRMSDRWVDRDWMEMPAEGGEARIVAEDRGFMDYGGGRDVGFGQVSPDGENLLVRSQRSDYRAFWIVPRDGGPPRQVDSEPLDQEGASWSPDGGSVAYVVQDNGTHRLRVASADGGTPTTLVDPGLGVVSNAEWSPDGSKISYMLETPARPAELYVIDASGGTPERLTRSNPDSLEDAMVIPQKISYVSEDGLTIPAYLFEPQGLQPGEQAPGIIYAHGGPTSHWSDSYYPQAQWLAQNGYAVLAPNVRGSSGYGLEFEDANNGCWGQCDLKDVIAGVDYLKTLPYANEAKMGMTGNSYGGIITMATVGFAPGLLQAAVPQSGFADWVKFFEYNDHINHVKLLEYEFGPFPDSIDSYKRASPIYELENATTPTFVLHGDGTSIPEWRPGLKPVPAGLDFARELAANNKTYRYKTYPNEGYYVNRPENRQQVLVDMLDFFDQFLRDGVVDLGPGAPATADDGDDGSAAGVPFEPRE